MKYEIIYTGIPPYKRGYGIRNEDGFILFFANIHQYLDQEIRFREEIEKQKELAEFLLKCLQVQDRTRRHNEEKIL